ncbi:hypothetical protein [Pseudozobellia thermophila]|uniref:YD repeat-containing protein n=1 Tax=Pseudozobellia thermophila TaxID=192903 RepID=A0A1M6F3N8_9FLAO|nr:hypothetical protein [Pseudozobellia thermophila]SHI92266.1 hypothetical protein SAMN04488513_102283 [Pseudozobellia thermophila]
MSRKHQLLFLNLFVLLSISLSAQEVETFRVEDFDLRGRVKSCTVITDYGKEEYYFDESGRLTKSITRFNDTDYETTYYKYKNGRLRERRVENYLDNAFDKATSIANFYGYDSLPEHRLTEKIVSYEKKLLEKNIYRYGDEGRLESIEHIDTDGIDQRTFSYEKSDSLELVSQRLNGVLAKTVQTSLAYVETDSLQKTVLTHEYLDGELSTKTLEIVDGNERPLFHSLALYDAPTGKWILQEEVTYIYDEEGILSRKKTKKNGFTSTKEYIYQFDGSEANNWVKEIITPDNTYKTRKIKYYPKPKVEGEE